MGKTSSGQTQIPAWVEEAGIENINRARGVQQIGYTPYYGADVAAFTPMQEQAMQATGSAAQAFGLAPTGFDAMAGMPQAQTYAGGIRGSSSAPMFEESLDVFRQVRPGQAQAMESLFIDPYSGQYTGSQYAPTDYQLGQTTYAQNQADQQAQYAHELALAQAAQAPVTNINVDAGDTSVSAVSDAQLDSQWQDMYSAGNTYDPGYQFVSSTSGLDGGGYTTVLGPDGTEHYIANDIDWSYMDDTSGYAPGYGANVYDDAALMSQPVGAASFPGQYNHPDSVEAARLAAHYGELGSAMQEGAALMPTVDPLQTGAASAGLAPQDLSLMDVLQTGMNVTPLNLGSALLTGSILSPNTAEIPVVDQSTATADLPVVSNDSTDLITAMASQGPTGTYNQAYWAEKLASGATQAELAAEQNAIAAAGGKVYTGSTPVVNTTTSSSSGKGG